MYPQQETASKVTKSLVLWDLPVCCVPCVREVTEKLTHDQSVIKAVYDGTTMQSRAEMSPCCPAGGCCSLVPL